MTDREKLRQYKDAVELIRAAERRLDRLRERRAAQAVDKVQASNPEWPYQPISVVIEGREVDLYSSEWEIRREEALLAERRKRLAGLRLEVEEMINAAPPRIAHIMHLKYIEGKTWNETAAKMGRADTGDAIRKELRRWLKERERNA